MKKTDSELSNAWSNNPPQPTNAEIISDSAKVTSHTEMPKPNDWKSWSETDKGK